LGLPGAGPDRLGAAGAGRRRLRRQASTARSPCHRPAAALCRTWTEDLEDCLVLGYEPLIEIIDLPDPDDRHVLAAAIKVNAQLIVTRNRKDFPVKTPAQWGVKPKSPDDFVRDVIDLDAQAVWACVQQIVDSRVRRPVTVDDVLGELQRDGLVASTAAL
jgi:hypothetical protein